MISRFQLRNLLSNKSNVKVYASEISSFIELKNLIDFDQNAIIEQEIYFPTTLAKNMSCISFIRY